MKTFLKQWMVDINDYDSRYYLMKLINIWKIWLINKPLFSNNQCRILQDYSWAKNPFKVQNAPIYFNNKNMELLSIKFSGQHCNLTFKNWFSTSGVVSKNIGWLFIILLLPFPTTYLYEFRLCVYSLSKMAYTRENQNENQTFFR